MNQEDFKQQIWDYYQTKGRVFPWRETEDPYKIMVSEIMLQQTQAPRVVPKYQAFLERFPDLHSLAEAPLADVLTAWQGLGYNRRAIALQKAAKMVVEEYDGELPVDQQKLLALPGIGAYTSSAILAFAFNIPTPFIETNIRRVYIHHFFEDREEVSDTELLPVIEQTMDKEHPREWYWALMDYGSTLPKQIVNPNRRSKHYTKQSKFQGSNRQLRGAIVRALTKISRLPIVQLAVELDLPPERIAEAAQALEKEGFLEIDQDFLQLPS